MQNPKFNSLPKAPVSPPARVAVVEPPTDEELFERQMLSLPTAGSDVDDSAKDEILEAQLKKQRTLEKLLFLKQPVHKKVDIGGMTFTIKLLTSDDRREISKRSEVLTSQDKMSDQSLLLLSFCIVDIDGNKLEDIYTGDAITDPRVRAYKVLALMPNQLINTLFLQIENINKEFLGELSKDFLVE